MIFFELKIDNYGTILVLFNIELFSLPYESIFNVNLFSELE